ncbi:antibiotic biosynthesis monooxygenase [Chitinophaga agrisoli]|uniref:Antibiotic biosynthesis monooxygenase n=1 Tax=Chitinophaga agrisoli TaxID=2607653 RepID=A0A5B2VXH9_9BACT|nr:antibiotic biosynthesis monooxygenase family protein [Chitinophaga agrisoli]KAA2243504.1 antibiotic biosynthesis monooxygenase [Chitinophaga agrisoli]
MTIITKEQKALTLVNVFTVAPERQEELLNFLIRNTDEFISKCPGFISASFHKGIDGKSVVVYAQYENMDAFQNMIKTEGGQKMVEEGSKIATSAQRSLCIVYDTRDAQSNL